MSTANATGVATAINPREEQAIRQRTEEFVAAWNKHDPKAMSSNFTEDGDVINPFGRTAKSRSEVERLFREEHGGGLKESHLSLKFEGIRFLTQETAVGDYAYELTGVKDPSGKETTMRGHLTEIFEKAGDKWLMAACRPMVPLPNPQR